MIFDPAGNLYGTTEYGGNFGGYGGGTGFELTPSGGTWTEDILYNFPSAPDGGPSSPTAFIMDQSGNLYGATTDGGRYSSGTIFELTPSRWIFSTLYTFATNGCNAQPVAMDSGNLYGTCTLGGLYDVGWVFELTNSGGSWTVTDLHDFTGGSDGAYPVGPVVFDSNGNLYGTTAEGGTSGQCGESDDGCGVVWEITP